ncbi:hypothetical protein PG996_003432 [Apiospora saccharicola]|uniref:F-box domain-containing protein n=1 Tax=Apiospora saccharicola TaxID=335842 RepID=A0ABR1W1B4_9PEZI
MASSSDEDFGDDSDYRRPQTPTRKPPARSAKQKKPVRQTRSNARNYREPSDDESDGSASGADSVAEQTPHIEVGDRKRKRAASNCQDVRRTKRTLRSAGSPTTPEQSRKRSSPVKRKTPTNHRSVRHAAIRSQTACNLAGHWASLPYLVWRSVFDEIASPLRDLSAHDEIKSEATRTLLASARSSKILAEPALTALYQAPPLMLCSTHQLLHTLMTPPDSTMFNYRPKVEVLRIEVEQTLSKKNLGTYLNLKELIQYLPRLKHIDLYTALDAKPWRQLDQSVRWKYSPEMFNALQSMPPMGNPDLRDEGLTYLPLESWSWSARLIPAAWSMDEIRSIHSSQSFQSLRKITFINFQVPSVTSKIKDPIAIAAMDNPVIRDFASTILLLPKLEHLVLVASTVANGSLLEQLPRNLKHFELINCWDVEADHMVDFLRDRGHSLKSIVLNHCQSLSLQFLPILGSACPNLEEIHVNTKYFRHHEFYNDDQPFWDVFLEPGQIPTWPTTLRCIDMKHLQFNEAHVAAHNFCKSLETSATRLLHLRKLAIDIKLKCDLNTRTLLRNYWTKRLQTIFKRPLVVPASVADATRLAHQLEQKAVLEPGRRKSLKACSTPMRRSIRLAEISSPDVTQDEASNTSGREVSRRGQVRKEARRLGNESHDADDEGEDELSAELYTDPLKVDPAAVQRLCDVVEVQLDNSRAVEEQFVLADIRGGPESEEEEEEDHDWNGQDEDFDI